LIPIAVKKTQKHLFNNKSNHVQRFINNIQISQELN